MELQTGPQQEKRFNAARTKETLACTGRVATNTVGRASAWHALGIMTPLVLS